MKRVAALLSAASVLVSPAFADPGDVLVRVRGIVVAPNEDAGPITPTFPGASVSVDHDVVPEVDFTYFFTNNIAAELIAATSEHDISATGTLSGLGEIASTYVLPPTLTLQYHFMPDAKVQPYVGVGVNWSIFYEDNAKQSLINAVGPTTVNLSNSVGWAAQAGMDIYVTDRTFFNIDVKYIDIDTTATLNSGGLINTVDVDIDPLVIGVGVGMRF